MNRLELRVSEAEKDMWKERALFDGFRQLGPWLRWLANKQVASERGRSKIKASKT